MTALAGMKGNAGNGRSVFLRSCVACHKVGKGDGPDLGPDLDKVATRHNRFKLVESIIDPNAEVEAKYQSTQILDTKGRTTTGLLISETKERVVLFDGQKQVTIKVADIETRAVLKQSSMPEGMAGAMAPSEFLDVIEYLSTLK